MATRAEQLANLRVQLDLGHPVTGAYDVDDVIASDQLHAVNLPGPHSPGTLFQYLALERFRGSFLLGRLQLVAHSQWVKSGNTWEVPELPLGGTPLEVTPNMDQIASAITLLHLADADAMRIDSPDFVMLDSRLTAALNDLGPSGCQVMGNADKTNIEALSENRWSLVQRESFTDNPLGPARPAEVTEARALP